MKNILIVLIIVAFSNCNPVSRGPYLIPAKVSDIDVSRIKYFDSDGVKIKKLFYDSTARKTKALFIDSSKIDTGIIFYWY